MPYDKYGRTPEMAERDHTVFKIVLGAALFITAIFALAVFPPIIKSANTPQPEIHYPTMDALTYTYTNDEPIYVYVVIDSDTGQQYLVTSNGGITPRLNYSPQ